MYIVTSIILMEPIIMRIKIPIIRSRLIMLSVLGAIMRPMFSTAQRIIVNSYLRIHWIQIMYVQTGSTRNQVQLLFLLAAHKWAIVIVNQIPWAGNLILIVR